MPWLEDRFDLRLGTTATPHDVRFQYSAYIPVVVCVNGLASLRAGGSR